MSIPCSAAQSSPGHARSANTRTTSPPSTPRSAAATSARRFDPVPETPTAIRPLTVRCPPPRTGHRSTPRRTTSPTTHAGIPPGAGQGHGRRGGLRRHDDHHAQPAVERRAELRVRDPAQRAQHAHDRRHRPRRGVEARPEVLRQRPRHVARQAAAGDVGHAADLVAGRLEVRADPEQVPGVDPRRRQQHVAQGEPSQLRLHARGRGVTEGPPHEPDVRLVQRQPVLRDQRPHQRVAVGVEPGRGEAHDRVAGPRRGPVEEPVPLPHPDAEPREVELVGLHEPRVLGRLAAGERRAGLAAALGDPRDQGRDPLRVQPPDRDVVEERERLGARAGHVVGAHRDEVDADRVQAAHRRRDRRLRPHAVGGRDDHRLPVARRDRDRGPEPAQAAEDLRAPRGRHGRTHQLDRALAGRHVHAGPRVGRPRVGHRVPPAHRRSGTSPRPRPRASRA